MDTYKYIISYDKRHYYSIYGTKTFKLSDAKLFDEYSQVKRELKFARSLGECSLRILKAEIINLDEEIKNDK